MPRVTVQLQGTDPNDLLLVSPQFIRVLIKDQDIVRLSTVWLRKKDGPCARELSTEAEAMGNYEAGEEKGKQREMMEQQRLADQK